jgi:hypothetical protein
LCQFSVGGSVLPLRWRAETLFDVRLWLADYWSIYCRRTGLQERGHGLNEKRAACRCGPLEAGPDIAYFFGLARYFSYNAFCLLSVLEIRPFITIRKT